MNLEELVKRAHGNSRAKRWWPLKELKPGGQAVSMEGQIDWSHPDADVPTKFALIHSEISEALEAWRNPEWAVGKTYEATGWESRPWKEYGTAPNDHAWIGDRGPGKPEGFPSELADVVIRCADLVGALEDTLSSPEFYTYDSVTGRAHWSDRVGENLNTLHRIVVSVNRGPGRMTNPPPQDSPVFVRYRGQEHAHWMSKIVAATFDLAAHMNIDLWVEIERKMAYNETRSHRHGGKRC